MREKQVKMILNIRHLDFGDKWITRSVLHSEIQRGTELGLTKTRNHITFFVLFVLFALNFHHSEARYVTTESVALKESESICHNQNSLKYQLDFTV